MKLFWSFFFAILSQPALAQVTAQYPPEFDQLFELLKGQTETREFKLTSLDHSYRVLVHSKTIQNILRPDYGPSQVDKIEELLNESLQIRTSERGLVQAANRELKDGDDPTNYNAVWVRDSLWAYLAFDAKKSTQETAEKVIHALLDYYSTADQLKRLEDVIANPAILDDPKNGNMNAVHIRFDGKSPSDADVMVNGKPQTWNHKQNDAIGLFFDLTLRAILKGQLKIETLNSDNWKALAYFPAYFARSKFYDMEDAGPWEEIDRKNASSTGLVTSGLELLKEALNEKSETAATFRSKYVATLKSLKPVGNLAIAQFASEKSLKNLINLGYEQIFKRLRLGGESPQYSMASPKYRQADAALLNLIYPARLSRLTLEDKHKVINIIQPLIGRAGVKRYLFDSYQSGNFWFNDTSGGDVDKRTDDTSSASSYLERGAKFIAGTEAQWFFDSWLSKCHGILFKEGGQKMDHAYELEYLNRSLGQITGGTKEHRAITADGTFAPSLALPESYNSVVSKGGLYLVASPITPLNWAKASLLLALEELKAEKN